MTRFTNLIEMEINVFTSETLCTFRKRIGQPLSSNHELISHKDTKTNMSSLLVFNWGF
jgi:hypothetical protein